MTKTEKPFSSSNMTTRTLSFLWLDISGFTNLLYLTRYEKRDKEIVFEALIFLFRSIEEICQNDKEIFIINHTGDGLILGIDGTKPSRMAVKTTERIQKIFKKNIVAKLSNISTRNSVNCRIALHHGELNTLSTNSPFTNSIHISDDLNLMSRVVSSQTAYRYGVAITKEFYRRLTLSKIKNTPDEIINDRNKYPEPICIYKLPNYIAFA